LPLFWLLGPKVGRLIPFERATRQIRPTNTRSELHNFDATARTERGAAQRAIYCPVLTMNPAADGWCRNWEASVGPSPAGLRVLSLHGRIHGVSHTWLPNSCSKYHHCPVIWTFFHQPGPGSRRNPASLQFYLSSPR